MIVVPNVLASFPGVTSSLERPLLSAQEEVIVMQRPQLRQSAQQTAKPLWSPSRSSTLGPANPGQQVQDQLLHFLHAVGGLKGGSVCREVVGGAREEGFRGGQEVSYRHPTTVCVVSLQ